MFREMPLRAGTIRCAFVVAILVTAVPHQAAFAQQQRGDTTIRMAARPVHAGVATLVPEISIGVFDGADEYMFGEVNELAVARDGSIYVFDRQVPALRKYDANGKFVKTFGRKGQGPGEYISGGGLGVLPDGRVLLWDTGNWRINVYSPNGDLLTQFNTPGNLGPNTTYVTSRAMVIDTAGFIYLRQSVRERPVAGQSGPPASRNVLIRLRADGAVVDTIEAPKFSHTPRSLTASLTTFDRQLQHVGAGAVRSAANLGVQSVWVPDHGHSRSLRVRVVDAGDTNNGARGIEVAARSARNQYPARHQAGPGIECGTQSRA